MLEELAATNLGLIESAHVGFDAGLTVVTGETGTGKTLMLGALRLLMGAPAPKGMIGPHADSLDVSAVLSSDGTETVVRRTVSESRSRAYLDGAIVTAGTLATSVAGDIAIVGQHDQHTITSSGGVRALLDRRLSASGRRHLKAYGASWNAYAALLDESKELGGDLRALEREAEMLAFHIEEIAEAGFVVGEESTLRTAVTKLRSAESLTEDVANTLNALGDEGAQGQIDEAAKLLRRASNVDADLDSIATRVDEVIGEIGTVIGDLVRYTTELQSDSATLATTEERLALLATMKRKYGDSIEDIVTFHKDAEKRRGDLSEMLASAADIEERIAVARDALVSSGKQLASSRRKCAERIAVDAVAHLKDLGFTDPVVVVGVQDSEPTANGADDVSLLFASDASLNAGPVSSVASGGELSRLVLALTLAAGGAEASVVAFDEIDAGIGGTTALAMGAKLAALAKDRQVICVTHLPQVAAHGTTHLVVRREANTARVDVVAGDARVGEIARMLAGLGELDAAQVHAAELLERSSNAT